MSHTFEVKFPPHLKRFIALPDSHQATADTVSELMRILEQDFPGVSGYLLHENGTLRQHVNVFLDDRMLTDRIGLSDSLESVKTVFVMQALSGG